MDTDNRYKIKNNTWCPCFEDSEIERQFMQKFNLEALKSGRTGFCIIFIVWVLLIWFDFHLNGSSRSSVLYCRFFIGVPLLLLVLAALYSKYAVAKYQIIVTLGLFVIEACTYQMVKIYDFQMFCRTVGLELPMKEVDGKNIYLFIWLVIFFLGSTIARLNLFPLVLNWLFICFLNGLAIFNYQPSMILGIVEVFFLLTILSIGWTGTLHVQQYTRHNFRMTKFLAYSMRESETLLLNILPVQIADRLKNTPGTIVDAFNNVSVLFSDLVGFTKLSEKHQPDVIVELLNEIFSEFDKISQKYGAEKIKTIGDAYMLAAGIPNKKTNHCVIVANCALEMLKAVKKISDPADNPIQIRIGIHTGPVIAGVIGTHKFSYDLWGDTVNTASRMESHGDTGRIQMTKEMADKLDKKFIIEPRCEIEVKGKGKMQTFWLIEPR